MKRTLRLAAAVLVAVAGTGIARASGPITVYALVDKVTLEPNAEKPERIRISGVFITAESQNQYAAPQRGYLYFTLPNPNADLAKREWADLRSMAGTRQVVGFGSVWSGAKLHIWKSEQDAKTAEPYPMGNGVVKVNAEHPKAKELLDYQ
jgi:hypothetical protein